MTRADSLNSALALLVLIVAPLLMLAGLALPLVVVPCAIAVGVVGRVIRFCGSVLRPRAGGSSDVPGSCPCV